MSCKEALSNAESTTVRLADDPSSRAKIAVTREGLEYVTAPLPEQAEIPLTRIMEATEERESGPAIDEVTPVRGFSRMTIVIKLAERLTGKKPLLAKPDLAVARGVTLAAMTNRLGGAVSTESNPAAQQRSIARIAAGTGTDVG